MFKIKPLPVYCLTACVSQPCYNGGNCMFMDSECSVGVGPVCETGE